MIEKIKTNYLLKTAEIFALILTVLMPLKFASIAGVPEMPANYWFDMASLILTPYPIMLFAFLSSILLLITLAGTLAAKRSPNKFLMIWGGIWGLLAFASVLGLFNASAKIYAYQMIPYTFGISAYAISLCLLLSCNPSFSRPLAGSVLAAGFLAVYSGLYQYFVGFAELEEHVAKLNNESGGELIKGQLASRIAERRVSGDFGICNTYGGFLAALLPFMFYLFYRFGETRVSPEKISKWLLGGIVILIAGFLILQSGSRGALFSLVAGMGALMIFMKMNWKFRLGSILFAILCCIGFIAIVITGRGFASMFFRFDYFQAAFRMMLDNPLFGSGWGDFFHDFMNYKNLVNTEGPHSPHNFVLLFASQCGVMGFISSLAVLAMPCFTGAYLLLKREITPYTFALASSVFVFAADSFVEISFESPAFIGIFAALGAILCMEATIFKPLPSEPDKCNRILKIFLMALGLTIGIGGAVGSYLWMSSEMRFGRLHELLDQRFTKGGPGSVLVTPSKVDDLGSKVPEWNPFGHAMRADYYNMMPYSVVKADVIMSEAIKNSPLRASFYLKRAQMLYKANGGEMTVEIADLLKRMRELSPKNPDYFEDDIKLLVKE